MQVELAFTSGDDTQKKWDKGVGECGLTTPCRF